MILQPLILLLIVDEISEEFPVARGVLRSLNDEVVTLITEVGDRLQVYNLLLYMHELLEAEGVTCDGNLGVTDLENAFQLRGD